MLLFFISVLLCIPVGCGFVTKCAVVFYECTIYVCCIICIFCVYGDNLVGWFLNRFYVFGVLLLDVIDGL